MREHELLELALRDTNQSGKSSLVDDYERELAARFGSRHAISVSSGSAAIQVALKSLGAAPGRSVAVSAMAPLPSLLPILATGATPLFVDSTATDLRIDPADLERAMTSRVVAALEVPLWGYPQDYTEVLEVLRTAGLPLVEDAAQAHGASISGRHVGTFGAAGCFSTHQKKLLSTGEGGFILTDDSDLHLRMRSFARLGNLDGASEGLNFKISAFTAAIGLARLPALEGQVRLRRTVALKIMAGLPLELRAELGHVGSPSGYNLVLAPARVAEALHSSLADFGIETDPVKYGYKVGYAHKLFQRHRRKCPNAELLIGRLIQIPTFPESAEDILEKVERAWIKAEHCSPSISTAS